MSLVLHVDGDRWRAHLRQVVEAHPGLVPVAKGNGYGFGNGRLARKAQWLGADTLAVGCYSEIDDVAQRFDGDLLVLTPWRPWAEGGAGTTSDQRLIHTVGRLADLSALAEGPGRPRVVLERLTSMKRHGLTARGLRSATEAAGAGVRIEGVSLHLPLGAPGQNLAEVEELMTDVVAAGLDKLDHRNEPDARAATIWVSHVDATELATLAARYPDFTFRPRLGTDLWLGDRKSLRVTARVLDCHPVERGEEFGYRRRMIPRTGTLLVVSGGTAHGIGLEAPTGEGSVRARAATLARGGLDAIGMVKSPYTVAGKARYFAEPPHMQASMLFLPSGVDVPAIGDEVDVRVRFTATSFDRVVVS